MPCNTILPKKKKRHKKYCQSKSEIRNYTNFPKPLSYIE